MLRKFDKFGLPRPDATVPADCARPAGEGVWRLLEKEQRAKRLKQGLARRPPTKTVPIRDLKQYFSREYAEISSQACAKPQDERAPMTIQTDLAMKDFHLQFWELDSSRKEAANWINLQMLWRKIQTIDQLLLQKPSKSKFTSVKRDLLPSKAKAHLIRGVLERRRLDGQFRVKCETTDRVSFAIDIKLKKINSKDQSISEGVLKLFVNLRLRYRMPIPNLNLVREVLSVSVLSSRHMRRIEFQRIFHKILLLSLPFNLYLHSHQSLFLRCARKEQRVFISAQSPNSQATFNNYLNENVLKSHEFSLESLSKRGLE